MGASPRHLSAQAAHRRGRRRVVLCVATVVVLAGGLTTLGVDKADGRNTNRLTVGGGRHRSGQSGATRSPSATGKAASKAASKAHAPVSVSSSSATSSTTAPPAADVLSSAAVSRYLMGRSGTITAAVYDVGTGTTSVLHPGVAEDTASIIKVDILETLLHGAQDTNAGASATSDPDSDDDDSDDDADAALNAEQQELATSMIEVSDNDSATALWNDDGAASGIAAYDRLVPLTGTVPGADDYWGLTTTTAADQVALVKKLALPGPLLDTTSRHYELSLMEHVVPYDYWGVSGGIPTGVTVALKNGWLPLSDDNWQINSIGWIDGEGRDYVVAVLTDGNPTEAYGIDTIQGLSSILWDQLAP